MFAISQKRSDVINLLQSNGIAVPANADDKVLHAMVLKAMISSKSFRYSLIDMLQAIAVEGEHKKRNYLGIDGKWYNQDGTPSTNTNQQQNITISNDTLNGLITKGIDVLAYNLTNGNVNSADQTDANIKKAVDTPPQSNSTFKTVAITLAVVGGTAYIMWYLLKKKK
jgi:hypothetical protein